MRNMKDSGVEWIGSVPASWQTLTIGSLFKVRNEKVNDTDYPPLSVTKGGIVPQMENVAKTDANDNRKMVLQNDFVINSRSDRKQSCGVSPLDGSVSLINTVLYPAQGAPVIPAYLNYLLKNYGFAEEFYRWGHGIVADLWTTRWQEMKSILLPVPSIEEQQQILDAISAQTVKIDTLIANVQMQIEKLKAYKQSLITEVVTKGLDPTMPMKDSGVEWIGDIPEQWNVAKARRIVASTQNGMTRRDLAESKGQIVLKLKNISTDGSIDYSYINRIELTEKELATYSLQDGDFLFVRVNGSKSLVGKCAIYADTGEVTAYNDHIIRVRINDLCSKKFFQYYLLSVAGKTEIEHHTSTSAGQFTISGEGLRDIWLVLPPTEIQNQLCCLLDRKCMEIDHLIALKQAKIEKLEQYKRSLIYEYVTGKREVSV
ncbi:MAG: restriction endonuclease subunit S [Bacillota bacterium]|nr:restriction endonuclease subunit S [Bacillota bacterium]